MGLFVDCYRCWLFVGMGGWWDCWEWLEIGVWLVWMGHEGSLGPDMGIEGIISCE